jgi:hypothetical protein
MAKLMWITNTTTWYEYELTPEEYKQYLEDEDKFMEENDVLGSAEIVREKVLGPDDIELIDDDEDNEEDVEEYEEE